MDFGRSFYYLVLLCFALPGSIQCYPGQPKVAGLGPRCLHVNTSTNRLVDGQHRERYFHGVNVVVKGPPWMPKTDGQFDPFWSFVEDDMALLQENGLNGMRYGMMWPGVEPQRGQYNKTYINAAIEIVNKAGEYGIFTLLDMHQDVLSEKFCGEGIPDWAVETGSSRGFPWPLGSPYKLDPSTGHPTKEDCAKFSWGLYQFTEAAGVAYQSLYKNVSGIRDRCASFWATVGEAFANNTNIIGYDIINEPWAGDVFKDQFLLVPKVADRENLAEFYDAIHTELRKKDDCHNFFFESVTWDETGVGFDKVPGGSDYANRSVISWHFYIPPQISRTLEFSSREKDSKRLNCGGFLSEFSMLDHATMDAADHYLQSWLGWDYKGYVDITGSANVLWFNNGTRNEAGFDMISRTYAQVVSGVTTKMFYDSSTKDFTLEYYTNRMCTSNVTQVYLNEARHYKGGYNVAVVTSPRMDGVTWSSPAKNYVYVQHSTFVPEGTVITVSITAKSTLDNNVL